MKKKKVKNRNFVQMYVRKYNVPVIFEDRKAKLKRGYSKHKKRIYSNSEKRN